MINMNWEAIGAIGEMIGAVAVLGTLAYVAMQIRQGAQATRTASELQVTDMVARWNSGAAKDREWQRTWDTLLDGGEVSDEDKVYFIWKFAEYCAIAQGVFDQHEARMVSERCWLNIERAIIGLLQIDYINRWWTFRDGNYSSAFYDHIDSRAKRAIDWVPKSSSKYLDSAID